jgi:hypothetical protein
MNFAGWASTWRCGVQVNRQQQAADRIEKTFVDPLHDASVPSRSSLLGLVECARGCFRALRLAA